MRAFADRAGDRRVIKGDCAEARWRIAAELGRQGRNRIDAGVICGSGLHGIMDLLEGPVDIDHRGVPVLESLCRTGSPVRIRSGMVGSRNVLVFGGRYHIYEGYTSWESALPVRILGGLGAGSLILTCASGSLNRSLSPGSILLIRDHVNLTFSNPGRGLALGPGGRFVDLCNLYDPALIRLARRAAIEKNICLREGVLASVTGPAYETRAEARMLRMAGADIVSMSLAAEAVVGRMMGLRVMGISAVTNYVPMDGIAGPLDHEEVVARAGAMSGAISAVVGGVIGNL